MGVEEDHRRTSTAHVALGAWLMACVRVTVAAAVPAVASLHSVLFVLNYVWGFLRLGFDRGSVPIEQNQRKEDIGGGSWGSEP